MKKLISIITILSAGSALAASTGNVQISGTVQSVADIVVTPTNNTDLNIVSGGSTSVATVEETCNDLDGYTIKAYSKHGSTLYRGDDNTSPYSTGYTVSYTNGASSVTLPAQASGGSQSYETLKTVNSLTGLTTVTETLSVDVSAYASAPEGTYNDTVHLLIEAN